MRPADPPPTSPAPRADAPRPGAGAGPRPARLPARLRRLVAVYAVGALVAAAVIGELASRPGADAALVLALLAVLFVLAWSVLTRATEQRVRHLTLRSAGPTATARLSADGAVELTWTSDAMAELLDPAPEGRRDALAGALSREGAVRLTAAVRDLVRMDGRTASLAVTVQRGWPRQVWLHLHVQRPTPVALWLLGNSTRRAAVIVEPVLPPATSGEAGGSTELAGRLRQALHRRRRWSSRVAVAVVTALRDEVDGPLALPMPATAGLAERVRQAARGTDTVIVLAPGRFAVLAEDVAEDGELVLARRVQGVLDRAAGDAGPLAASVAVMEVADADADPDAVVASLLAARASDGRGVTVLGPWTAARAADPIGDEPPPAGFDRRMRAALASGRFVLGERRVAGANPAGGAIRTLTVTEVCTVDEGLATPVRVDAPGLAAALDRWLVEQVAVSPPDDVDRRVLLLQPGGELGSWLAAVPRPGGRLVVAVPERRLLAALTAERAVLREMALRDVPVAVTDWSGLIDVPTLVRSGIDLVLLAPETQRAATRPEGAALLAGLVAGLRAGLGETATVIAEDPPEGSVTSVLQTCGVVCATATPVDMMRTS